MVNKELYTKKEAANYLAISVRTLERIMAKNEIAFIRDGRTVRFLKSDLDDWIQRHRVKPKR